MKKRNDLHALDVAVALSLLSSPNRTFSVMGHDLGISPSTVHKAVGRLFAAGLLRPDPDADRAVNRHALLLFLEHGVRYAFPAVLGASARGVPTAHAGPALRDEMVQDEPVVWPSMNGDAIGASVEPLLHTAARIATSDPDLYALLAAVDAVRLGRAREVAIAMRYIRERVKGAPVPAALSA